MAVCTTSLLEGLIPYMSLTNYMISYISLIERHVGPDLHINISETSVTCKYLHIKDQHIIEISEISVRRQWYTHANARNKPSIRWFIVNCPLLKCRDNSRRFQTTMQRRAKPIQFTAITTGRPPVCAQTRPTSASFSFLHWVDTLDVGVEQNWPRTNLSSSYDGPLP